MGYGRDGRLVDDPHIYIICYHYLHRLRKILAYPQNRANGCPFHGKNTRNS